MNSINGKKAITLTAGAGIGAGLGVVAGSKLGEKAAKTVIKNNFVTVDEYVRTRISANMDKVHTLKQSKWTETFQKISEKASSDYSSVINRFTKNSKAGMAVWGALALGLVGLVAANKVVKKVDNVQKQ